MAHAKHIRTNKNTTDVKKTHTKVQTTVFETQASHTTIKTNVFDKVISRSLVKHIVSQAQDPRNNVQTDSLGNLVKRNVSETIVVYNAPRIPDFKNIVSCEVS